jgi:peptide deformylase
MTTTLLDRPVGAGVVRPVLRAPHPALTAPGAPVDPADPATVRAVADLVATMQASPGCVGLAAPQLGLPMQVLVVDVTGHPRAGTGHGRIALCNALVVEAGEWEHSREGCPSVLGLTAQVWRAGRVVVSGQLPGSGEQIEVAADALEARALQHQIDHCAGRLFLDRIAGARGVYPRRAYH